MLNLIAKTLLEIETLDAYQIRFLADKGRLPTDEEREMEQNRQDVSKTSAESSEKKKSDVQKPEGSAPTVHLTPKEDMKIPIDTQEENNEEKHK